MSEKKTKVKVNHLTKKFGDLLVLNDMSFDVEDGDLLCVVGPTGCGKTTFLNSLTKIYDITDGEILLNGEQVDPKKQNIAYIFQGDSTMPWLTVEENVCFGLDIKKIPEARKKEQVDKYLEIVGLSKYRKYYPKQLSASNSLNNYTIVPLHMFEPFSVEELQNTDVEMVKDFGFTKGIPVMKIPASGATSPNNSCYQYEEHMKYGDLLFDLKNDPDQNTSIMDTVVEDKMIQAMKGLLEENEAPQELYDRIGLNMN